MAKAKRIAYENMTRPKRNGRSSGQTDGADARRTARCWQTA